MFNHRKYVGSGLAAVLLAGAANAQTLGPGEKELGYIVTITNVSAGLTFTPAFVALHDDEVSLFALGQAASDQMEALAEAGDTGPLTELGESLEAIAATATGDGPIAPGESAEIGISGPDGVISVAAMLLPTNDGFYAVSNAPLPGEDEVITVTSVGYDAGTETNDELCASIPGPDCGGAGVSVEQGEGYVHVHRGIHGIGDLDPASHDWRNPVALVSIRRATAN